MLQLFQDRFVLGKTTSIHFFRVTILTQQLQFLPSSHFLRIGDFLGQLLFATASSLADDFFSIKISTEMLLFRGSYFCTTSTFSEEQDFGKN